MSFEYIYPKKKFEKKDIEFMRLFFDNGDYFSLHGSEVVELQINLYDRLVWNEYGVCPVAESGFIKLKVNKTNKAIYNSVFLYNAKEYKRDRKGYIAHRCVNEGGIKNIQLFDQNNWQDNICGNIVGEMDGEFLVLKFITRAGFGSADSDKNVIFLNEVSKSLIDCIDLDFENCEGFTIYKNEIQDIQLQFEQELVWGAGDLFRSIKCGYIKFKLDNTIDYRSTHFLDDNKITLKKLIKRLCWKGVQSDHDICHLYIDYDYAGFGSRRRECIEVADIRSREELERIEKLEDEGVYEFDEYIGGYCKKQRDGSLIITFGKNAKALLKKLC